MSKVPLLIHLQFLLLWTLTSRGQYVAVYSSWTERPKNKDTKNNKASLFYTTFRDLNKAFSVTGKSRKVKHHWLRKAQTYMSDGMEGRDNIDFYSASLWSKVLCSSRGIVLISARKMSFLFRCFFIFALNKYTGLQIKFSASPWSPVDINPYIWPLVFDSLVEAYLLTPWSRALLEKLTGSAASQEIPRLFGSSPYPQAPATYPYPEPTPSSPHNSLPLPEDPS